MWKLQTKGKRKTGSGTGCPLSGWPPPELPQTTACSRSVHRGPTMRCKTEPASPQSENERPPEAGQRAADLMSRRQKNATEAARPPGRMRDTPADTRWRREEKVRLGVHATSDSPCAELRAGQSAR